MDSCVNNINNDFNIKKKSIETVSYIAMDNGKLSNYVINSI